MICRLAIALLLAAVLASAPLRAQDDPVAAALAQVRAEIAAERQALAQEQAAIAEARLSARAALEAQRERRHVAEREAVRVRQARAVDQSEFAREAAERQQFPQDIERIRSLLDSRLQDLQPLMQQLPYIQSNTGLYEPLRSRQVRPDYYQREEINVLIAYLGSAYQILLESASAGGPSTGAFGADGAYDPNLRVARVGWIGGVAYTAAGPRPLRFGPERVVPSVATLPPGVDAADLLRAADLSGGDLPVGLLLLDLSAGRSVASPPAALKSWREQILAGGAVVWPLLGIALLALLMVLERALAYARMRRRGARLEHDLPPLLRAGEFAQAEQRLAQADGPLPRVWRRGLHLLRAPHDTAEEAMQEAVLAEIPAIERFLSTLAVFAAIAPLLGLLGTVSGMIKTFDALALQGAGNAAALSGGISEALVSTWLGLLIAIPILLAHASLVRQARLLVGRLDQAALLVLEAAGLAAAPQDRHPATPPDAAPEVTT